MNGEFNYKVNKNDRLGIIPFPKYSGYSLTLGERSDLALILQVMLNALSINYDLPHIAPSGEYDVDTSDAIRLFQRISKLEETGDVDGGTWDRLAEEYNFTVNENQ